MAGSGDTSRGRVSKGLCLSSWARLPPPVLPSACEHTARQLGPRHARTGARLQGQEGVRGCTTPPAVSTLTLLRRGCGVGVPPDSWAGGEASQRSARATARVPETPPGPGETIHWPCSSPAVLPHHKPPSLVRLPQGNEEVSSKVERVTSWSPPRVASGPGHKSSGTGSLDPLLARRQRRCARFNRKQVHHWWEQFPKQGRKLMVHKGCHRAYLTDVRVTGRS